jgi:hypothetical protein
MKEKIKVLYAKPGFNVLVGTAIAFATAASLLVGGFIWITYLGVYFYQK